MPRAFRRSRKPASASAPARDETQLARAEAETALAALPDAAEIEGKLADINAPIARERSACAEQRGEAQAIARESELAHHRLRAIAAERQEWNDRNDNAAAQIATLAQRTDEAANERAELIDAPQKFEAQRQALIGEIETATGERRAAADQLAAAETDLAEADKAARIALEAVGEARAEAARSEERHDGATPPARRYRARNPRSSASRAGDRGRSRRAQARRRDRRRSPRSRPRSSASNRSASGSARSISSPSRNCARSKSSTRSSIGERDDLVEAIRRLRQGIHSLNHEARERLLTSFQIVNENFKKLFAELFGGGNAELQLIESEDPLEAGLEIMAKPPGKKPATLSLLSGGEQALTALALIFAVFLTNPAPICVLDEVDAPLDDYNVERFCTLLDEMTRSTETRFIIITHNPITMARMNRLYGVTMAERGVSQLVSVDLEGAVKLREAS